MIVYPQRLAHARLLALAIALVAALAISGCGGSSGDKSGTGKVRPAAGPTKAATVTMGEFFFAPSDVTVRAGKVRLMTPNEGRVTHELVLIRTNTDPGKLPTSKNGEAKESHVAGEISDVGAGQSKKGTFNLKPGKYAMICNLPGHYRSGMYGSLTVK